MSRRILVIFTFLLAALTTGFASNHIASAAPTCTDPSTGQAYEATKWLTSPGTLTGTSGRDVLLGSGGADTIKGLGGNDLICSAGGDDIIDAGSGNDVVHANPYPGPGYSQVRGGNGDDWLTVQGEAHGDAGNDHVEGRNGTLWGDAGNDYVRETGGNAAYGGAGDDEVIAVNSALADGGSGNDYVHGSYNPTALEGGSGSDLVVNDAQPNAASVNGGSGQDTCTPRGVPTRRCETLN